jgi:hypothetical protein
LGDRVLVFDTETTTDRFQNLLVGAFQIHECTGQGYALICEGLIVGNLLGSDQGSVVELYARRHGLRAYSRPEFIREVFIPEIYRLGTLCVGFNLPFDLSRLAVRAVPSRGRALGGFTFYLTHDRNDPPVRIKALDSKRSFISFGAPWKPGRREAKGRKAFPGWFLDLRTLVCALTGEGHSLQSACAAFEVQHGKVQAERHGVVTEGYLDYNRQDVQATWELFLVAVEEWHRHPFAPVPTPRSLERDPGTLLITGAFSPATLCKAYLRTMGIRPRLEHQPRFPRPSLGRSMVAYYGGRSECHIRRQIVPVTYLDVLSMYPTIGVLMKVFRFVVADRVVLEDATREARDLLDRTTPDSLLDPAVWPELCVLAEVEPDGDILPIRAQYQEGGDYQIGLNVVTVEQDIRLYYMLPDLVASKLLTGKAPRIRQAWRFVPEGLQKGLRPVKLLGEVEVDPRQDDFLKTLIERRHEFQRAGGDAERRGKTGRARHLDAVQHGLKDIANCVYGVLAEIDEKEATGAQEAEVFGVGQFTAPIRREEHPGLYAFPPLAAPFTSGARLVMAMLEAELASRGATYAFCDTDSVAIVGGPEVVQEVRARLARLVPYGFKGHLLKIEDENYALIDPENPKRGVDRRRLEQLFCYAISAKRYVLFNVANDGTTIIRKGSEHGLGHLLGPLLAREGRWIDQAWASIIRWARGGAALTEELGFANLPAVARFPITKPSILSRFDHLNTRKEPGTRKRVALPYVQQVKPFNFMLVAFPDTGDITTGGEAYWESPGNDSEPLVTSPRQPIRPIAPYESDPGKWQRLPWVDLHTGRSVRLMWGQEEAGRAIGSIRVQTYGDVLHRHVIHPEAKAAGPDGEPCGPHTEGELRRLRVHIIGMVHIGKESHELEDVQAGLTTAASSYVLYRNMRTEWERDRQILRSLPRKELAKISGLHLRSIKAILNTNRLPHPRHRRILHDIAEKLRRRDPELANAFTPEARMRPGDW